MEFNLKRPCPNCPFRNDKEFPLFSGSEIAEGLLSDKDFACHKTVDYDNWDSEESEYPTDIHRMEACAGAMIVLEKMGRPTQMMQIGQRLGFYNPTRLEMDAPVYDTLKEFIDGTLTAMKKSYARTN